MRWWHETRPADLSASSRPLEASKSDIQQYAAWLAGLEPPLAAATRARRLAVISAFYELAEEHELVHRTRSSAPLRTGRRIEERKIANVTRHKNITVLRRSIRTATAVDDVGEVP